MILIQSLKLQYQMRLIADKTSIRVIPESSLK